MKTLSFKTNIKCGGCIAKVTPTLQNAEGIAKWEVDTGTPDKILTVQTDQLSAQEVQALVQQAGFTAQWVAGA
jgi:copper chaperone